MTASCSDPQFDWLFNKEGQSPCEMAYQLAKPCNTGAGGNPGVLQPDHQYPALATSDANPCTCNTVRYVLIVGCSACQSRDYLQYVQYTKNCSTTYNQKYPATIPAGTAIPNWAYLPLDEGTFDWTAAQFDGDDSESTGGAGPTTSKQQSASSSKTTTAQTTNASAGSTDSANTKPVVTTIASNGTTTIITYSGTIGGTLPTSTVGSGAGAGAAQPTSVTGTSDSNSGATTSGSSKAGPIAGGVVGGVVVICLFLGFVWWHRQRLKDRRLRDANEHLRPMPLMDQYRDGDGVEPPPYALSDVDSDVAPDNASAGPVFTKSAYPQYRNTGAGGPFTLDVDSDVAPVNASAVFTKSAHPQYTNTGAGAGSSGHQPMSSEGGSSPAQTKSGSRSGSDQV